MILAIDTASTIIAIGLFWPKKIKKIKLFKSEKSSAKLLAKIDQFLKSNKIKPADLKAIIVNRGPGFFTGLRVGASIANTLGYALKIPTIGITISEKKAGRRNNILKIIKKGYQKFRSGKVSPDSKILPIYYQNIE